MGATGAMEEKKRGMNTKDMPLVHRQKKKGVEDAIKYKSGQLVSGYLYGNLFHPLCHLRIDSPQKSAWNGDVS